MNDAMLQVLFFAGCYCLGAAFACVQRGLSQGEKMKYWNALNPVEKTFYATSAFVVAAVAVFWVLT
jgi:hypothetical protein